MWILVWGPLGVDMLGISLSDAMVIDICGRAQKSHMSERLYCEIFPRNASHDLTPLPTGQCIARLPNHHPYTVDVSRKRRLGPCGTYNLRIQIKAIHRKLVTVSFAACT
jgi:hypothetical protein